MGECIISRRGGNPEGKYAYEVKQYIAKENTVSSIGTYCKTVIYGNSYSIDPATKVVIIPNGIRMDVTAANKDMLVGKYITGPNPSESYCLTPWECVHVTSITAPSGTNYHVTMAGTQIRGVLQRIKMVLQDSNQYPTDTIVGNEIRKDL